jgi:hypothetical protein
MDIQLIRLIGEFVVDLTNDALCKVVNDLMERKKPNQVDW